MHPFTYFRPATAAEAVRAIGAGGPGTRILAGGTTIYDLMKLNIEEPTHLIDVTRLEGLDCIDAGGAELTLGANERRGSSSADCG